MAAALEKAIAILARRQRGYVTRLQLLELGLGEGAIKYRVEVGRLIRVYTGVYAVGHLPTSAIDRANGAVLACGPGAVLSHGSAAGLWGFSKQWGAAFEVTVSSARRHPGIRVHRSTVLVRRDVKSHLGVHVTSPARTILDIACRLSDKRLTRTVNDARLSNYLRLPDLAELLGRCPRHPAANRLRSFVEAPNGPTRSQFEDAFLVFTERFDLPRPKVNTMVAGYEVDALFEAEKLIVELDGCDYHRDRAAFEYDRNKDADTVAAGFATVRITWQRLTRASRKEADRLDAILGERRALHGDRRFLRSSQDQL